MKRFLAIVLFVLPITCFPQSNLAANGTAVEVPDNLFCSGFEACPPFCGDATLDPGELCDDGNQVSGDGCSANCLSDETCGNQIIDYITGEQCDDGHTTDSDGCSATCQLEGCVPDSTQVCVRENADGSCTGLQTCEGDRSWSACSAPHPVPEICDGVDNDCNGSIDDFPGELCSLQEGVCGGSTRHCVDDLLPGCVDADYGPNYEPVELTCDYLDNDCDGTVDDDFVVEGKYVATQHCGNCGFDCTDLYPNATSFCDGLGTPTCAFQCDPGYSDLNQNPVDGCECLAAEEICDGLDNDCNGEVDEGYPGLGESCSVGIGACEQLGTLVCGANGSPTECSATVGVPTEEICDYLDNDCDGEVDQTFKDPGTGYYVDDRNCGVCGYDCDGRLPNATSSCSGATGTPTCAISECDEGWYDLNLSSVDGCECLATPEICDGQDNDCDGQVDEGLGSEACSLQTGVCSGSVKQCGGAAGYFDCGRAEYGRDYETTELTCDGRDNDCDGETDEEFGVDESCGLGACAGGVVICSNDGGLECSTQSQATTETCNGVDDDCDGIIDEGC